jgi:putative addiction module component (TIGR02574 family)
MTKYAEQILAEALELPPLERAELVENILSSFEFKSREAIDALWAAEAEDRIEAFDRGEITTLSADEVFADVEKRGHR